MFFDDDIELLDVIIIEEEWRDEYRYNEFDLDPDNYDSVEEFLEALNNAKITRLEDEEYDEDNFD